MAGNAQAGAWRPDLHAHTAASDGVLSATQVVARAQERSVNLLAVTDHDTLLALDEAAAAAPAHGVQLIPGVEISAAGRDEVHVLGYFVNARMRRLQRLLQRLRDDRVRRCDACLARLEGLGLPVLKDELRLAPGVAGGRPLIARAMVRRGYVSSVEEAFERYLAAGRPAYIERYCLDPADAIALLKEEGAVPVLAHPGLLPYDGKDLNDRIDEWVGCGLMGIEAYHPQHAPQAQARWAAEARRRGLMVTGGSDFHDALPPHADLGQMLPLWDSACEDAARLLASGEAAA